MLRSALLIIAALSMPSAAMAEAPAWAGALTPAQESAVANQQRPPVAAGAQDEATPDPTDTPEDSDPSFRLAQLIEPRLNEDETTPIGPRADAPAAASDMEAEGPEAD